MQDGSFSRRNFLKKAAVGTGALVVGASGLAYAKKPAPPPPEPLGYLPYTTLDVDLVRKLAWKHYFLSGG